MRQIQVRVPDGTLAPVVRTLDELDVDYVVTGGSGPMADASLVEFPVPTDAVDEVLTELREAGLEEDAYVVGGAAEFAVTEHDEVLLNRYAADFDPLTRVELRSKARDLSYDRYSYVAMIFLSAVIATAGLLVGSPAVVVGSMVIAPFVGPILTAGVGTLTNDREMMVDSVLYQGGGILIAVTGSVAAAALVRWTTFVPTALAVTTIESMATRIAPGVLSVAVGLVAGAAAAFALSTKGPTALVGVMIAAALVPTAAAIGIAAVWAAPVALVGATLLLLATVVAINVGVISVLWWLGYRPEQPAVDVLPEERRGRTLLTVLAAVVIVASGVTAWGVATHATFERQSTAAVEQVLDDPAYADLELRSIRQEYGGPTPVDDQRTVTVVLARSSRSRYPDLPATLAERVAEATGRDVAIEVRYVTYHRAERGLGRRHARPA